MRYIDYLKLQEKEGTISHEDKLALEMEMEKEQPKKYWWEF